MKICLLFLFCMVTAREPFQIVKVPLYGSWVHSFEEDKDFPAGKVYRPASYQFAPARGRDGFEIRKGGIFISHAIALADGNTSVSETWKLKGNELIVTGKTGVRRFKVLALSKDRLALKPL